MSLKVWFGWLIEMELWLVLLASITLWSFAYQQPYRFQLDVGGNQETRRRLDDAPYLIGFNDPEPAVNKNSTCTDLPPADNRCEWWELSTAPYRWATSRATIHLPGIGSGRWVVALHAGGQPLAEPVVSMWSDSATTVAVPLPNDPQHYALLTRATPQGDLTVQFTTPQLDAPGDRRQLGFRVQRVVVSSSTELRMPSLSQLGLLAVALTLVYGMGRTLCFSRRLMASAVLGLALLVVWLLVAYRMELTIFTPLLVPLLAGAYALQLLLLNSPWLQVSSVQPFTLRRYAPERLVVGLVILAFILRLGGLIHPTTRDSDIGLNANNLSSLIAYDGVYMTEALPSDIGGARAPYPPAQYLVAAPVLLLTPSDFETRKLLLKIVNSLLDSLLVAGIWLLLRQGGLSLPAALCGAALYILPTPVLRSFSIGELGNISGQAFVFPALALLALAHDQLRERRVFWPTLALLALAFLGHSGVTLSLGLLLASLWWLWLAVPAKRAVLPRLTLLALLALGSVILFYYSVFIDLSGLARGAEPVDTITQRNFAVAIAGEMRRAFGSDGGASLLTALLGLAGLWAIYYKERRIRPSLPLTLLLLAWWSSALLALLPLLIRDQTVRWAVFLYPVWCVGAAPVLM
ncbi:MAG: hypothetical protein HC828_12890, partial [Blastochloris sp.]|nr:hypothetical protein [Blastochloris sp.]